MQSKHLRHWGLGSHEVPSFWSARSRTVRTSPKRHATPGDLGPCRTPLTWSRTLPRPLALGSRQPAQPGIIYHYRVVAYGPGGAVRGGDRTFRTPKVPLSVQIVGSPNPVVFGDPFFVEGTLSGTGAATHEVVLQANPFPYLGGFKTVGNPEVTNSAGDFSFPVGGLLQNAQLRVVTVGRPEVASPVVLESVAVRVSFHVRRARRHGFVRLYGTVAPAEVGALVGFQLLRPGKSVNEGGTSVRAGTASVSRFGAVVRLRHRGLYRALIKVTNDGGHVSNYSEPILIR